MYAQEGKGNWSETVTAQTAAVPPDSPSALCILGSNRTSVSIRWEAPEADGGSTVLSYQVELRPKSKAGLAGMTDEWLTVYQVSDESHLSCARQFQLYCMIAIASCMHDVACSDIYLCVFIAGIINCTYLFSLLALY